MQNWLWRDKNFSQTCVALIFWSDLLSQFLEWIFKLWLARYRNRYSVLLSTTFLHLCRSKDTREGNKQPSTKLRKPEFKEMFSRKDYGRGKALNFLWHRQRNLHMSPIKLCKTNWWKDLTAVIRHLIASQAFSDRDEYVLLVDEA